MSELVQDNIAPTGIDTSVCEPDVRREIDAFLTLFNTSQPSIVQIWAAMDFVWHQLEIDNRNPDPIKLSEFYSHPVWLLNGLFIEQHSDSLRHRRDFAEWVATVGAARVADFGGGFGTLGRLIARRCPQSTVEVVDPYPRPEAERLSRSYPNLHFSQELDAGYDVIIATDVFEHVLDPVGLAYEVGSHVQQGGYILTANHFAPSIKCHLPTTFHFNLSWDEVMAKLGFTKEGRVSYGDIYRKKNEQPDLRGARRVERLSRQLHQVPRVRGVNRIKRILIKKISKAM